MKNRHFDYFNQRNSYTCLISIPFKKINKVHKGSSSQDKKVLFNLKII